MTEKEAKWCADMHRAGVPLLEIAEKISYSTSSIRKAWKKYSIDGKCRKVSFNSYKKQYKTLDYEKRRVKVEQFERIQGLRNYLQASYEELRREQG